jgi:hypothetical protein
VKNHFVLDFLKDINISWHMSMYWNCNGK